MSYNTPNILGRIIPYIQQRVLVTADMRNAQPLRVTANAPENRPKRPKRKPDRLPTHHCSGVTYYVTIIGPYCPSLFLLKGISITLLR